MKKYLFYLAAGVMTLSACTSEEVVDVSRTQGNAIGFENVVNKNTRAIEGKDLDSRTFDTFMVYGYYTKDGMSTPIQIFNGVPVMKDRDPKTGSEIWTYDGVRYWIPKCTYYFYAYSCGDIALSTSKGMPIMPLTNQSSVDGRALTITNYICDGSHQHDLICADNEQILASEKGNPDVALSFSHALCKVKASFTTDFPAGYTVKVSNVRLSDFDNYADYNVHGSSWTNHREENVQPINLVIPDGKNAMSSAPGSSVDTGEVYLIPKTYNDNEHVKLHFSIELSKDGQVVLQRNITGNWPPRWQRGNAYKYNINITGSNAGIQPIVFAATQSLIGNNDWTASDEVPMEFGVDAVN